jgi:hypothetical protein
MMKAIVASPVYLLVSVLFWLFFWKLGYPMLWAAFGFGVLGWWIAYLLRAPISLVLMKITHEKQPKGIVYFSGLLEESVRLIALKITGTSFQHAISVGQGWAFIEVLFAIVNLFVLTNLNSKTDEKSLQAKQMLSAAGIKLDGSPFWGALERVFASGFHIGSTLIISWNPLMFLAMIPVHTAFNVMATRLLKKSIIATELVSALFGSVVFIVGLIIYLV